MQGQKSLTWTAGVRHPCLGCIGKACLTRGVTEGGAVVSLSKTLLLGLIAGGTIVFGLPVGRMRRPAPAMRAVLNALAIGILLFLVWDVLTAAWEPIDAALGKIHDHSG